MVDAYLGQDVRAYIDAPGGGAYADLGDLVGTIGIANTANAKTIKPIGAGAQRAYFINRESSLSFQSSYFGPNTEALKTAFDSVNSRGNIALHYSEIDGRDEVRLAPSIIRALTIDNPFDDLIAITGEAPQADDWYYGHAPNGVETVTKTDDSNIVTVTDVEEELFVNITGTSTGATGTLLRQRRPSGSVTWNAGDVIHTLTGAGDSEPVLKLITPPASEFAVGDSFRLKFAAASQTGAQASLYFALLQQ